MYSVASEADVGKNEANANADAEELGRGEPHKTVFVIVAEKAG